MTEMLRSAVFLDRDGVINRNRTDHVKSWSEFEFLPGVLQSLRVLAQLAWPIIVVSNQAAIGRGLVSREMVEDIHRRMTLMVEKAGGRIDAVLYCPHRPDEGCMCRKPANGLLLRAAEDLHLDLARSFMVGDAASDIYAASAVGCQPILVKTGRGKEQLMLLHNEGINGFFVAEDLDEAVTCIMRQIAVDQFVAPHLEWQDAEPSRRSFVVAG